MKFRTRVYCRRELCSLKFAAALGAVVFLIVCAWARSPQNKSPTPKSLQEDKPDTCEVSTSTIAGVKEWYQRLENKNDTFIVVIAHASKDEKSGKLARKRLQLALDGLIKLGISEKSVVLAEGDSTAALPTTDFFVGGRIVGRIVSDRNALFCIECCSR